MTPRPFSHEHLLEVMEKIERNAEEIFVRAEINGVWRSYRLASVPAPVALHWAFEWIRARMSESE
jgi:hypothetical protein